MHGARACAGRAELFYVILAFPAQKTLFLKNRLLSLDEAVCVCRHICRHIVLDSSAGCLLVSGTIVELWACFASGWVHHGSVFSIARVPGCF
jgi:hypothetical protein